MHVRLNRHCGKSVDMVKFSVASGCHSWVIYRCSHIVGSYRLRVLTSRADCSFKEKEEKNVNDDTAASRHASNR